MPGSGSLVNDPLLYEHENSKPRLRTTATSRLSGLTTAGLDTELTISNSWVPLPTTPLTARNSIRIQNQSEVEIKTNFSNTGGYEGIIIPAGGSDILDITDNIIVYGRATSSGSHTILVRELS